MLLAEPKCQYSQCKTLLQSKQSMGESTSKTGPCLLLLLSWWACAVEAKYLMPSTEKFTPGTTLVPRDNLRRRLQALAERVYSCISEVLWASSGCSHRFIGVF